MTDLAAHPSLVVSPQDSLADHPISVVVDGLRPGQRLTVTSQLGKIDDSGWATTASFIADANGRTDLSQVAPDAGDFSVADANALLWALRPSWEGAGRATGSGTDAWDVTIQAETKEWTSEPVRLTRRFLADGVVVREIRDPGLVANLFLPPGTGPHPTVLVVSGSGGGFADTTAALYASHGYAALSLAYFNAPGLPDELLNIPLEYFANAIAWIERQPELDTDRLGISGTSRGGELALLLASRHPKLRFVIAYVPSSHVWGAVSRADGPDAGDAFPSWTQDGQPIAYAGRVRNDDVTPEPDGSLTLTPSFHRYLQDTEQADAAAIAVERINGPVLLISGQDDALWPSTWFGERIVDRLRRHRFEHAYTHLAYDGAGHAIGPRLPQSTAASTTSAR